MKKNKFFLLGIFLIITSLLTGCNNKEGENYVKTQFLKDEKAKIDYYEITYQGYSSNKEKLYLDFLITNNSKETKEINLNQDFVLYTNNHEKITNLYEEQFSEIKSGETKNIRVTFQSDKLFKKKKLVELDSYKLIFYSGVVSNNIAFIIE